MQRIAAEIAALRTACDTLNLVIEQAPDGICVADGNGNQLLINSAFERISGVSRSEVPQSMLTTGKNVHKMVSHSVAKAVIERQQVATVIQKYKPTGKQALVTGIPLFDETGKIRFIVCGSRDVTELTELRERLTLEEERRQGYEERLEVLRTRLNSAAKLVAEDESTLEMFAVADRAARVDSTILLTGETGTGKEELARYLHNNSPRKGEPFVAVNCGAIPKNLVESELFGYDRGAFTGALKDGKMGLLEAADKGTLFLDEVGELPPDMQVKLLRALESRTVTRVGGRTPIPLDIRVISATHRDLKAMLQDGSFREDLYYRICVVPIHIPALRERRKDIIPLTRQFLAQFNRHYDRQVELSEEASLLLQKYPWPGNIRELKNVVENLVIMVENDIITAEMLPFYGGYIAEDGMEYTSESLKTRMEKLEYLYMRNAYAAYKSSRSAAAALGMTKTTFSRKYQQYQEKYPLEP